MIMIQNKCFCLLILDVYLVGTDIEKASIGAIENLQIEGIW